MVEKEKFKAMNTEQADQLFNSIAIAINGRDVVPTDVAEETLGKGAVKFAKSKETKGFHTCNYLFTGVTIDGKNHYISYLTRLGFLQAVTYNNVLAKGRIFDDKAAFDLSGNY